jgi:hypothetical protein
MNQLIGKLIVFILWGTMVAFSAGFAQSIEASLLEAPNSYAFSVSGIPSLEQLKTIEDTPFWSFFWEFGDGHFSRESTPDHTFEYSGDPEAEEAEFSVRVRAMPIYSANRPPDIDDERLISPGLSGWIEPEPAEYFTDPGKWCESAFNWENDYVKGDTLIAVVMYRNLDETGPVSGKVSVAFDPAKVDLFPGSGSIRPYAGESLLSDSDPGLSFVYEGVSAASLDRMLSWEYAGLEYSAEGKRIFLTMKVNDDLEDGTELPFLILFEAGSQTDTSLVQRKISGSHDPNLIRISPEIIPATAERDFAYRVEVHFENYGSAIAREVAIQTHLDPALDITSISNIKVKPFPLRLAKCDEELKAGFYCYDLDPLKNVIYWHMIAEIGTMDRYATGFVKFDVKPKAVQMDCKPLRNFGIITFDDNEAVRTNTFLIRPREDCHKQDAGMGKGMVFLLLIAGIGLISMLMVFIFRKKKASP